MGQKERELKMVEKILRKAAVLQATGWSNSTLYKKILDGKFPPPVKMDPDGRASGWFESQVAEVQKAARERQTAKSASAEVGKLAATEA
jgi:prophage regulatory protein